MAAGEPLFLLQNYGMSVVILILVPLASLPLATQQSGLGSGVIFLNYTFLNYTFLTDYFLNYTFLNYTFLTDYFLNYTFLTDNFCHLQKRQKIVWPKKVHFFENNLLKKKIKLVIGSEDLRALVGFT